MRLIYLGTPVDAVPPLQALHAASHDVALVVTQPDRRRGRGAATDPTPVKAAALELGLPVITPERAGDAVDAVAASGAELGVVVAFGQLLPPALLAALPLGFVNAHFSLLPRWRGAAPIERAILAGDPETGVCIMGLEAGLDTGPVYARRAIAIGDEETAGDLHQRLTTLGADLLVETVPNLVAQSPVPQVGEPTYAAKLTVEEFRLDPNQPAATLARLVRAGSPRPGAWLTVGGHRLKVWRAHVVEERSGAVLGRAGRRSGVTHAAEASEATPVRNLGTIEWPGTLVTANGCLTFDEVQAEGKRPVSGQAWMNGIRQRTITIDPA